MSSETAVYRERIYGSKSKTEVTIHLQKFKSDILPSGKWPVFFFHPFPVFWDSKIAERQMVLFLLLLYPNNLPFAKSSLVRYKKEKRDVVNINLNEISQAEALSTVLSYRSTKYGHLNSLSRLGHYAFLKTLFDMKIIV